MMPCLSRKFFGVDCPGCGIQRSFVELLKGNFAESFYLYPALIPILLTFAITAAHLIFKYRNGAFVVQWSYIFSVTVIIISFIVKQF